MFGLDDGRRGRRHHLAGGIEGHPGAQGRLTQAGGHGGGRTAHDVDGLVSFIEVHAPGGRHRRLGRVCRIRFLGEVLGDGVRLPQGVVSHHRGGGGVGTRILGIELGGIDIHQRFRAGRQVEASLDRRGLHRLAGLVRDLDGLGGVDAHRLGGAIGIDLVPLQVAAGVADHVAAFVEFEGAGAGVAAIQVGQAIGGHEEAVALNGEIQRIVGELQRPLVELLRHRPRRHPVADLGLGIDEDGVGVDIGELGAGLLEAGGIDVGNVVRGDVQVFLSRIDAAEGIVE
ncbi:hypothetical protein D3C80_933080 [compost metagenome]